MRPHPAGLRARPGPQIPACLARDTAFCRGRRVLHKINKIIKSINGSRFSSITKLNPRVSFLPLLRGLAARAAGVSRPGRGVHGR